MTDIPAASHPTNATERSDDRIDPELYGRYLTGEATPDERAAVEQWAATPSRRALLQARADTSALPDKTQVEQALARLRKRRRTGAPTPIRRSHRAVVTATTIGLATLLAFVALGIRGTRKSIAPSEGGRVYTTGVGQRATLTLADGSRLMLAPASRVEVARDFGKSSRTVMLNGEAYFTVASAAGTPFLVRTGNVETRVLGTTFDVRRYAGDRAVRVAVVTGRIAARNRRNTVQLSAGDVSHLTDSSVTVARGDVVGATDWTQGHLVFTDTPLPVVLATLGRWYGYDFQLTDSALVTQYVTATFDANNPREAMGVLKEMLGVTLSFDGLHVTLRPAPRSTRSPHAPAPTRRGETERMSTSREIGR